MQRTKKLAIFPTTTTTITSLSCLFVLMGLSVLQKMIPLGAPMEDPISFKFKV